MNVWVGMDVHRTRSQIAIVDAADVQQRNRRLANDPAELIPILGALAPGTPGRLRGRLRLGEEVVEFAHGHLRWCCAVGECGN